MSPFARCWRVLLLCWALALGIGAARAGELNALDAFDGRSLEVLEDRDGRATLDDVRAAPSETWQVVGSPRPNFGFSSSAWWFRATLPNTSREPQRRLLVVSSPLLDHLDVHVLDRNGGVRAHWTLGDKQPFHARAFEHRDFVVPLEWGAESETVLYLRVRTGGTVQLPLRLVTDDAFERERDRMLLAQGMYFGTMAAMVAFNLFLLLLVRDSAYSWYVAWAAALTAFAGSLTGLSFQFLWPDATRWNDTSLLFFLFLALGFGCLFARSFLGLAPAAPRSAALLRGLAALSFACALAAFFVPYALLVRVVALFAVLLSGIGVAIAVMRLRDGFVPARYYLFGWGFVLLGGVALALARSGVLPSNPWTEHAAQIGSAIETIVLAWALAARINSERRLREQAQAELVRSQREANERLDARVRERTAELERVNALLHELSQTDALTGVHNRRHLDEVLRLEWQRASRGSGPLGLLLIDIDHFKHINDEHGHAVGDECLKQIARTIRQHARRSTDLVARYGGEEFCALMPGIEPAEAMAIAEQLRRRIEQTVFSVGGLRLQLTASLGVCCRVPRSQDDTQQMLNEADAALYRSKRRGRNCVTAAAGEPSLVGET